MSRIVSDRRVSRIGKLEEKMLIGLNLRIADDSYIQKSRCLAGREWYRAAASAVIDSFRGRVDGAVCEGVIHRHSLVTRLGKRDGEPGDGRSGIALGRGCVIDANRWPRM